MNYLAHVLLSGPNPDKQVGGLLGDFVKGPLGDEYPPAITAGIRLHRRIDSFTDCQPEIARSLDLFPARWRRYGGIVLDIYFDYLLARSWSRYHHEPLEGFCQAFYRHLEARKVLLPPRALHFCEVAPKVNWLESYRDRDNLPRMIQRVGNRLRRPVPLEDAMREMFYHEHLLEAEFSVLFPRLLDYAKLHTAKLHTED